MPEKWCLHRSMQGVFIEVLQRQLIDLGFDTLPVNGFFDETTENGVKILQYKLHLPVNGLVDRTLWHLINNLVYEKKAAGQKNASLHPRFRSVIFINLQERTLSLHWNQELLAGPFPVAIGKPQSSTPTGLFSILLKRINPGGALGTHWMVFTENNHAIHGTNQPSTIGKAVTAGCLRMLNKDIETLYDEVKIGSPVFIVEKDQNIQRKIREISTCKKPASRIYSVEVGDTLSHLAQKVGCSERYLMVLNDLESNRLYPGQTLILPEGKRQ